MERAILAEMAGAVLFSLATLLACSWRLCSSMRGRRLDAAVLSIVVSICVWGMAGTCCLLAGRFHPLDCSVLTILGAVGLLGIRALAGLTAPSPPSNRISRRAFVGCAAPEPLICDIDADGVVDILDIRGISARRGEPALPGDPADIDGDGVITVGDARNGVYECTLSRCAIP